MRSVSRTGISHLAAPPLSFGRVNQPERAEDEGDEPSRGLHRGSPREGRERKREERKKNLDPGEPLSCHAGRFLPSRVRETPASGASGRQIVNPVPPAITLRLCCSGVVSSQSSWREVKQYFLFFLFKIKLQTRL